MTALVVLVTAVVAALLALGVAVLIALPFVRVYISRRLASERAAFGKLDAKTWRETKPMLLGVQEGSLSHVAGIVQAAAPVGLTYTFRSRETAALPRGAVRVSFELGTKVLDP